MRIHTTASVHAGTPSPGYNEWVTSKVHFHGFADLPADLGHGTESPEFGCLGHDWTLRLYPGGKIGADMGMVSVFLHGKSNRSGNRIHCAFGVRDDEAREVANKFCVDPGESLGVTNFTKRSRIMASLVDQALDVEVHMKLAEPGKALQPTFIPENPLCGMIRGMFMDEESADVAFEVPGKVTGGGRYAEIRDDDSSTTTFHAHRFILRRCSTALGELCGSTGGGTTTPIPIAGVSPDIFRHLLYYMYGGKVAEDDMKSNARDLIDAADRFGVTSLKLEAEARYVDSTAIATDNVMELLLHADSRNCALLKEAVMDFVLENAAEVLETVPLKDAPGGLIADVLAAVVRGRDKKVGENNAGGGGGGGGINLAPCASASFAGELTRKDWTLTGRGKC